MDVRRSLIQTQRPVQNVNVFAKAVMELFCKFRDDQKKLLGRSVVFQCPKLIEGFFGTGLFAGEQIFDGTVSFCVANFGIVRILFFNKIGVVQFVVELFYILKSFS